MTEHECMIIADFGGVWYVRALNHGRVCTVHVGDAYDCARWARREGLRVVVPPQG